MGRQLSDVLDECLTLLAEERASVEECLARYPQYADDLRPLLEVALKMRRVPQPIPRPPAAAAGRRRMLRAVAQRKRRQVTALSPLRESIPALFAEEARRGVWRPAPALRMALAAAAILVLLVGGGLLLRSWLDATVVQMTTLDAVEGVVEIWPAGGEGWLPASADQALRPGVRIRTGASSVARLSFFDGSITVLEADTEMVIARLSSQRDGGAKAIVLRQPRGRTHHRVQPMGDPASRFEVRSPLATTVVRGTEFAVSVEDDGTTEVAVGEGLVEFRAKGKTVEVRAGDASRAEPDQPPTTPFVAPTRLSVDAFLPTLTSTPTETPKALELTDTPRASDTPQPSDTPKPQREEPAKSPVPVTPIRTSLPPTPTVPPTPTPLPTEPGPLPAPTDTPTPPPTPTALPTEPGGASLPQEPTATPSPTPTAMPD